MSTLAERYLSKQAKIPGRILEIGTKKWDHDQSPSWKDRIEAIGCIHLGTDALPGECVDQVVDAHVLSLAFEPGTFRGFVCCSTLEHIRRPWVVAKELSTVCSRGSLGFVQTHQSFPVHGYPCDYWRFTTEALAEIFCADYGWRVLVSEYEHPAKVVPMTNAVNSRWNFEATAWLNVSAIVERL